MGTSPARRIMWMAVAAVSLVSCGTKTRGVNGSQMAIPDLQGFTESIANTEGTRNAAAASIVAASEKALAAHPEFSTLEPTSVATIHGDAIAEGTVRKDWHSEDTVEFRKGPSRRVSVHVT